MNALPPSLSHASSRNYGLDVMRSSAVLFVLLSHGTATFFAHLNHRKLVDVSGWLGFLGVELFFALSGFLIGGILLRTGEKLRSPGGIYNFWRKRWYRTLPNYWAFLLLHLFFVYSLADFPQAISEHWKYFIFVQALAWPHPGFFAEAWSLAIEEWFYLLTPILVSLLLALRLSVRSAFFTAVAVFVAFPLLLRWWLSIYSPELNLEIHRKLVLLRLDGIMYGVIAAMVFHYWPGFFKKSRWFFLAVAALLLSAMFSYQFIGKVDILHDAIFNTLILSGAPLASACLLPYFYFHKNLFDKVASFHFTTARLSYSLYLCNLLVLAFILRHLNPTAAADGKGAALLLLLFVAICYATAELSYRLIEKPWLALRDRPLRVNKTQPAL